MILRVAVGADNLGAGGRGEMVERAERLADAPHAALHVGDARRRPDDVEARLEAVVERQRAVLNRELEVHRARARPRALMNHILPSSSCVSPQDAPFGAVGSRRMPCGVQRKRKAL